MSDASVWAPGSSIVNIDAESTNVSQVFTSLLGQTVYTLTVFTYTLGTSSVAVYRNGQRLVRGVDWQETTVSSITLLLSPAAGETIEVVAVIGSASESAHYADLSEQAAATYAANALASQQAAAASEALGAGYAVQASAAIAANVSAQAAASTATTKATEAATSASTSTTAAATASAQSSAAISAANAAALSQANAAAVLGLGIGTSYVDALGHLIMTYVAPVTALEINTGGHLVITF